MYIIVCVFKEIFCNFKSQRNSVPHLLEVTLQIKEVKKFYSQKLPWATAMSGDKPNYWPGILATRVFMPSQLVFTRWFRMSYQFCHELIDIDEILFFKYLDGQLDMSQGHELA